jgi:hypothetical protein
MAVSRRLTARRRASAAASALSLPLLALLWTTTALGADTCPAGGIVPYETLATPLTFPADKNDPAVDLSGMACKPGSGVCLLINDDSRFAQVARIEGNRLVPFGPKADGGAGLVSLVRQHQKGLASDTVFGTEPGREPGARHGAPPSALGCTGGHGGFGNFDGEAVAYDGKRFTLAGSHGCSRGSAKLHPSTFVVARLRIDDHGRASDLEMSYRLSEALQADPSLRQAYARPLGGATWGLNIEGVAAVGPRLLFGLRSPLLTADGGLPRDDAPRGDAIIVGVDAADLFRPAGGHSLRSPSLSRVSLGENAGIRDLTPLDDGRLLLLSGPARHDLPDAQPPFKIWEVAVGPHGRMAARPTLRELACLAPLPPTNGRDTKPEGLVLLGPDSTPGMLRILVLNDGPVNGAPAIYRIAAP